MPWWNDDDRARLNAVDGCGMCADAHRAGRAISAVVTPRKIDYLVMGHRMPHLHCHLLPQHSTDDPTRDVDISDGPVFLESAGLAERADDIRTAWTRL